MQDEPGTFCSARKWETTQRYTKANMTADKTTHSPVFLHSEDKTTACSASTLYRWWFLSWLLFQASQLLMVLEKQCSTA